MKSKAARLGTDEEADAQEARLLTALAAGDAAAYETLVRRHGPAMLAVAIRILSNEDDARDAVQDAFISAHRALPSFNRQSRLSTWLHRITVNACLMKLRAKKSRPEKPIEALLPRFSEDGHQADPAAPWHESGSAIAESSETKALVRRSIAELPENYRIVLTLRDIEELSTEETASALGIAPNAVKVRLHRARQALRGLLDPHLRRESIQPS